MIRKSKRRGKSDSINLAFDIAEADSLVLLDADIRFADVYTLAKLLEPLNDDRVCLVGANIIPWPRSRPFEIACMARRFDWLLEKEMRGRKSNSFWSCYGRAMALSRRVYSALHLPRSHADDLYIYFFCLQQQYRFAYASEAVVYFQAPMTIGAYIDQFSRFAFYAQKARSEFGEDFVDSDFNVGGMTSYTLDMMVHHPLLGVSWILCRVASHIAYLLELKSSSLEEGLYKTASGKIDL